MKIAVLSGKGGTGKTFVSVNLASVLKDVIYIDCDVEEPNGHIFLKPETVKEEKAEVMIPTFDKEKCIGCRKCMDFCKFNALVYIKEVPKLFQGTCHSCGGCKLVCPKEAIGEETREIGKVYVGQKDEMAVITGMMNLSEESGVAVIEKALEIGKTLNEKKKSNVIIDCPPGSACTVMESIKDADFCLMVAEKTPFGFHNFKMILKLVRLFHKPCGIVFNKDTKEYDEMEEYIKIEKVPVLLRVPFQKELATYGANGEIAVNKDIKFREMFEKLYLSIREEMIS